MSGRARQSRRPRCSDEGRNAATMTLGQPEGGRARRASVVRRVFDQLFLARFAHSVPQDHRQL